MLEKNLSSARFEPTILVQGFLHSATVANGN